MDMEMAAPILVLGWFAAVGVVGALWGADSRDGFTEESAVRRVQRWFIEPR